LEKGQKEPVMGGEIQQIVVMFRGVYQYRPENDQKKRSKNYHLAVQRQSDLCPFSSQKLEDFIDHKKADPSGYDQESQGEVNHGIASVSNKTLIKQRETSIAKGGDGMKNRIEDSLKAREVLIPVKKENDRTYQFHRKGECKNRFDQGIKIGSWSVGEGLLDHPPLR